jgi:hypothetical protein
MKYLRRSFLLPLLAGIFVFGFSAFAQHVFAATGTIDATSRYSQFRDYDGNTDSTFDRINWRTTNGTPVTVSDTALTGNLWGETVGWINLNPTNGGVTNTTGGILGGYAWGENTGWINFAPTNGGVTIDTSTGEFSGDAWSQNYGWITFSCPGADTCVITDWRPEGSGGNDGHSGNQLFVPGQPLAPACSDGIDNDQDGVTDYPNDTGCAFATDSSEYLPPIDIGPRACSDGVDNDGDELVDYPNDPGCSSFSDNKETDTTVPVAPGNVPSVPVDPGTNPGQPSQPGMPTSPIVGAPISDGTPAFGLGAGWRANDPVSQWLGRVVGDLNTDVFGGKLNAVRSYLGQTPLPLIAQIVAAAALVATVPGVALRVANALLGFLGYKKRNQPWGVVYDSVTKRPLDPAYITLVDMAGTEVASAITDLDGRYTFLVGPGTYTMRAGKTSYTFPSKLAAGKTRDELYNNLYFGQEFTVTQQGQVLTFDIPMDPVGANWNETAKQEMNVFRFFSTNDLKAIKIINALFIVGFVFSLAMLLISPVLLNAIITTFYLLIFLLEAIGLVPAHPGHLTRLDGSALSFAIVRVWTPDLSREVAHRVADESGNYYILIGKGTYRITIDVRNSDGTYTRAFTSGPVTASKGIINRNFVA